MLFLFTIKLSAEGQIFLIVRIWQFLNGVEHKDE